MNFTKSLLKHIDKLVGSLRSDEQIQEILKRKFTKKEYKVFVAFEEGKSIEEIKALVKEVVSSREHKVKESKVSTKGKYKSYTLELLVHNDDDRTEIYKMLGDHSNIKMVL